MSIKLLWRLTVPALRCLLFLAATLAPRLLAQATTTQQEYTADIAAGVSAERSLRVDTGQNFWMEGASAEAGVALWHRWGPAVNVTGVHGSSIGESNVPLSLITAGGGPRLRLNQTGRWSPYGEAMAGVAYGFGSIFPAPNASRPSATSLAVLAGGGLDFHTERALFIRVLDVSYLRTYLPNGTNNLQNTLRIGVGVGWRCRRR